MSTYTPPPKSLVSELLEAVFTVFVGTFLQIGRAVQLIGLKWSRASARAELRRKAIAMGEFMEKNDHGDQMLIKGIRATPAGRERDELLAQLGELWLSVGQKPMGAEAQYAEGHDAYERCRASELKHDEVAYKLWPHNALGWTALFGSYVFTAFLALLAYGYMSPENVPSSIASLVGRGLPIARFGGVRVEMTDAKIDLTEFEDGGARRALAFRLRVTNGGSRPVAFRTWRGEAKLLDDRGEQVRAVYVTIFLARPIGSIMSANIDPGKSVEDVLLYELPASGYRRLDVFLPGENVGIGNETRQMTLRADQVRVVPVEKK